MGAGDDAEPGGAPRSSRTDLISCRDVTISTSSGEAPINDNHPSPSATTKLGLRAKLVRVYALQVLLISVAALIGVFMTYVIVENVLTREALETEAQYYWEVVEQDPSHPLPNVRNMVGYLAQGDDYTTVPENMRSLQPGFGRAQGMPGKPLIFVDRNNDQTLYLVFAEAQVADLVFYFGLAPLAAVLLIVYILLFLTYRLSHAAISPMLNLAKSIEQFDFRSTQRLEVPVTPEDVDRETRLMVEALQEFSSRLENFIERERTFTRDAGHELRTPIAVMKGSLDILESNKVRPETDQKVLQRMRRVVVDMETLLETLLMLAREEDVFSQEGPTSVNQVVAEEIELLSEYAEKNSNRIELVEEFDVVCNARPRVLAIIMSNLIRNALTYTQKGRVTIRITDRYVAVTDTGIGMSDEDMDSAFTAFFRGEQAKNTANGQGLGLALVRRLAQQLDWRVDLDSEEGVGTEFRVWYRN